MRRWLIATALAAAMSSAGAQVYRWTDSTGKTHFTDTPPPAAATNVQKRRGAGAAEPDDAGNAPEPYALQHARKTFPVKLYSAPGCGPCDQARALLNARGVPFSEISVSDPSAMAELKEVSGSALVPVLLVGNLVQKGFEEGAFHQSLDGAGYPKSGLLPRRNQAEPGPVEPSGEPPAAEAASARGPYAPRSR
jgi:glutaredoxin